MIIRKKNLKNSTHYLFQKKDGHWLEKYQLPLEEGREYKFTDGLIVKIDKIKNSWSMKIVSHWFFWYKIEPKMTVDVHFSYFDRGINGCTYMPIDKFCKNLLADINFTKELQDLITYYKENPVK